MKKHTQWLLLFIASFGLSFALIWGKNHWFPANVAATRDPSRGSHAQPEECEFSKNDRMVYVLEDLAKLASMLPPERCMHGPAVLIFGQEFFSEPILDRWGNEFFVDCHQGPQLVRVFSFGPDGKKNTEDDIGRSLPWVPRPEEFRQGALLRSGRVPSTGSSSHDH